MRYIGYFDSVDLKHYKVEIETKKSGADQEIILGDTPFTSSISSDDDTHIYCPIKCGGATVTIVTKSYIPDLYAGQSKAVKVSLTNTTDNVIEWVGYVTPTIYSQPWEKYLESMELECVDGIAVLKDIKYKAKTEKKDIITFADIMAGCLNQAECYKYLYISDNVQLTSQNANDSVIEMFRMSERGLYDKKDDITQDDSDVAWSCYDVLYEICQYLGYTLITDGENVIIMDYDAIRKGNNTYFKYALGNSTLSNPTKETLQYSHYINGESYSKNGTNIEMSQIYNKATVVDEFNSMEDSDEVEEVNITATSDPYFNEAWIESKGIGNWVDTCDTIVEQDELGNNNTYQIWVHRMHAERWYYTIVKIYTNEKYKTYRYSKLSPYTPQTVTTDGLGYMMNSRGAAYMKYCHIDLGDDTEWHNSFLYRDRGRLSSYTMEQRRNEWVRLLNSKFANLSFNSAIVMMNGNQGNDGHIGISNYNQTVEYADLYDLNEPDEIYKKYPYFEYVDENPAIFGSKNAYIMIKATYTNHDEWWNPFPMNDGADNDKLKYDQKQKNLAGMFMWCKLQWGDRWYNGDSWQTTECYFKLYWWLSITEKKGGGGVIYVKNGRLYISGWNEHWVKRYFDRNLELADWKDADFVLGEKGIYINAPQDGNLTGSIKFITYCPRDIWDSNKKRCDRYWTCVQVLKDFTIEGKINTGGSLGDAAALDSDTVYTNIIDNGSVEEMEEITFKICTFDDKNASYSLVDYLDAEGKSHFLDKTYNKANYNGEGGSMRQEEHLVYKLVTQYEEPMLILNCNLKLSTNLKLYGLYTNKTLSGKTFIIEEVEKDYRFNSASIKLREKV